MAVPESYRECVSAPGSRKSKKLRQCEHCGEMSRGLIGAPRYGWIHSECLKLAIAAYTRSWPRNFWK
jgi:hypothetical protein